MRKTAFAPCIPTPGTKVPAGKDWLHEIKYDGYRLIVHRDGDRVRLLTNTGHDYTKRYPWIAEAALKNRQKRFVIDGEAVVLGRRLLRFRCSSLRQAQGGPAIRLRYTSGRRG
jgi:bifunctional non-homologous end joining protein LigD